MDLFEQLLQDSAKLYQLLTNIPKGEERDEYISQVNVLLDNRGKIIESLQKENLLLNRNDKSHATLIELDKAIGERLNHVLLVIKDDLRNLNQTKKSEQRYLNPYSNVGVMDGKYYDKKN